MYAAVCRLTREHQQAGFIVIGMLRKLAIVQGFSCQGAIVPAHVDLEIQLAMYHIEILLKILFKILDERALTSRLQASLINHLALMSQIEQQYLAADMPYSTPAALRNW